MRHASTPRPRLVALLALLVLTGAGPLFAVADASDGFAGTTAAADTAAVTTASPTASASAAIAGVIDCNTTLRVRAWPWGRIIGGLQKGDKVEVLGVSGDFYKIRFEGGVGYVHRNYVSLPDKPARQYGCEYPPGTSEGGNGYLPRPGEKPQKPEKPEKPKPGADQQPVPEGKTANDKMGDGTAAGAVTWALNQMAGGKQKGVNSNNGKRSSDITAWNHYCLAFVATAWGRKISSLAADSAWHAYQRCKSNGRAFHTSGTPKPGAAMFFGPTSGNPYGHAIIATGEVDSKGDPWILSTSGWGGHKGIIKVKLSEMKRMMGSAKFLGWTNLP